MGSQEVQKGFTRFDSLYEPDKAQWGKEVGLRREWKSLDAAIFGSAGGPLKFAEYRIDSPTGGMASMDASMSGKTWSFEHIQRSVDSGFAALPNLTPAEIDGNIGAIAKMYVKEGVPVQPQDRTFYLQSPGLSRNFTRLSGAPYKDWSFSFA